MRTYGRDANNQWQQVDNEDAIYATTLAQNLYLETNESPFYAAHGIPSQKSILTQIYPDYHVVKTQDQFSQYFASLQVSRGEPINNNPKYVVDIITKQGIPLTQEFVV